MQVHKKVSSTGNPSIFHSLKQPFSPDELILVVWRSFIIASGHSQSSLKWTAPRGTIGSMHMLHALTALELEAASHTAASWFHGQECYGSLF